MRESFFQGLYEVMKKDRNVVLLMADTGALVLDDIKRNFPERFLNVGIAEQNMIGLAAGLAMSGKIVYTYAIIPFVTMRCYEQIRIDVCGQNLNVKMIGIGAGMDYSTLGPTHHAHEDIAVMRVLPKMTILSPCDKVSAFHFADLSYLTPGPVYVRFERYADASVYEGLNPELADFGNGLNLIFSNLADFPKGIVILTTGKMVVRTLEVAKGLREQGIGSTVVDVFRIKTLNIKFLTEILRDAEYVATIEENSIIGGLGSAIAEFLTEYQIPCAFKRVGLPDEFCREYGSREFLHKLLGLDTKTIVEKLVTWIKGKSKGVEVR